MKDCDNLVVELPEVGVHIFEFLDARGNHLGIQTIPGSHRKVCCFYPFALFVAFIFQLDVQGDEINKFASKKSWSRELGCAVGEDANLGHSRRPEVYSIANINW